MTLLRWVSGSRRFETTYSLHIQGPRSLRVILGNISSIPSAQEWKAFLFLNFHGFFVTLVLCYYIPHQIAVVICFYCFAVSCYCKTYGEDWHMLNHYNIHHSDDCYVCNVSRTSQFLLSTLRVSLLMSAVSNTRPTRLFYPALSLLLCQL